MESTVAMKPQVRDAGNHSQVPGNQDCRKCCPDDEIIKLYLGVE